MADWTKSMQQSFEYYKVDPNTWADDEKIDFVSSSTLERDEEADTLGSASFEISEDMDECYVRVYLITIQNGVRERHVLGTYLVQASSDKFDGKGHTISVDGYTPLIELKETLPPLGYTIMSGAITMDYASQLTKEHVRAPVIAASNTNKLYSDYTSDTDDTWLSYLKDLIATENYEYALDERGRILYAPIQETSALTPVWTYSDDNSSILYPEITTERDLYSIPNVVEVFYSSSAGYYYAKAVNDDPNSPVSTVARGREIVYRVTDPDLVGVATQRQITEYAETLLKQSSVLEYKVSYTHGYCPVRLHDCVRLNYERSGLKDVKAKVVSQSIKCSTGCVVTETAVYTKQLWG